MKKVKTIVMYLILGMISAFGLTMFTTFTLEHYSPELNELNQNWQLFLFIFIFAMSFASLFTANMLLKLAEKHKNKDSQNKLSIYTLISVLAGVSAGEIYHRIVYVNLGVVGKFVSHLWLSLLIQVLMYFIVLAFSKNKCKEQ